MIDIALAKINSLPKTIDVSPNEEAVFILTSSQLQEIITRALQPLQDHIESLEAIVTRQDEKIAALESTQETQADNQLIQLRLIAQLREATKKDAQPMQKDRADILRALIAANGGKMLVKDARQKMHLGKEQFSLLISKMGEYIDAKPLHSDNRKKILVLRTS